LRDLEKLEEEERNYLKQLLEQSSEIAAVRDLAQEFSRIIKEQRAADFTAWVNQAAASGIAELKSLATGLQRDREAVVAALTYDWSNGQTVGQVNRLRSVFSCVYGGSSAIIGS
jgi:transposase